MRWYAFALALVAVAAAGVAIVSCSDEPSCTPGTLLLHIALIDDSPSADTITITGIDPGAAVSESFPNTVDPVAVAAMVERTTVVVTFPGGYPTDALVHLVIRALLGGQVIGVNTATIQLGAHCGEGSVLVSGRGGTDDDAGATGGF